MADNVPEEMLWDWGDGVLMISLVDLGRVTGEPRFSDYARRWIDHHLDAGYRHLLVSSDRCPPAVSALALFQQSCEPAYRAVVTDTLTFLYDEARRSEDGGINHLGSQGAFGVSLWLDSLFMFGTLLTRWGEHEDDSRALDEMHTQITVFASHLQDDGGFMMHAYNSPVGVQDPGVYWGRGNAWVTAAGYEYLALRAARGESDPEVEQILARQADAIIASQDPATGLWWTVLNRPSETYLETSASALFAVGLARGYRAGLLSSEVLPAIDAAIAGVTGRLLDDGGGPVVSGTSGPTTVGGFDDYAGIGLVDGIHYGTGAVILALIEGSGLE